MRKPTFRKPETRTELDCDLGLLPSSGSLPPDLGIVGTIQHVRQLLFDFAQAVGAQLESCLIQRIVPALFGETGVQVTQIGNFLTKAGEVFRDIGHRFDHTLYILLPPLNSATRLKIGRKS
jgi:hypothetical protein